MVHVRTTIDPPTGFWPTGFAFWLVSAYGMLVGGFAGWCGKEFWTWQNVSLVVVPAVVVALIMAVRWWWQNPGLPPVVLSLVGGVMLAGMELILAATMAAFTERWSSPAARAAVGAGVVALGFFLTWAFYIRPRRAARPPETNDLEGRDGPG
jgi:hypothetical protein